MLLAEVEKWLLSVAIEYQEHDTLVLTANGLELNNADTVMTSYLRMIEVTRALEGLLDKIRNNDIAFNRDFPLLACNFQWKPLEQHIDLIGI